VPAETVSAQSGGLASASAGAPQRARPRLVEWLWRGAAMAQARRVKASVPPRVQELERRARMTAELGRRALEPSEPLGPGGAQGLAAELYRQSAHWALQALGPEPPHELLLRAARSPEALAALRRTIAAGSFAEILELPAREQADLALELRRFTECLLDELDLPTRTIDAVFLHRVILIGAVLASLGMAAGAALWAEHSSDLENDLAAGKPWRASSSYGPMQCRSPDQSCEDSPHFFVHTKKEVSPWVEIDLGAKRRFSTVRVVNRKDCCFDRLVPLVIEISHDQKTWHAVARRKDAFTSWRAKFTPVAARWVRLRVDKRSLLHVASIRVLP
jgi:hypothetical protein